MTENVAMTNNTDILAQFGTRLRVLRLARGLSQEVIALEADLDRTYVSGVERGLRNVSLRNITALARALDLSLAELFDGIG